MQGIFYAHAQSVIFTQLPFIKLDKLFLIRPAGTVEAFEKKSDALSVFRIRLFLGSQGTCIYESDNKDEENTDTMFHRHLKN